MTPVPLPHSSPQSTVPSGRSEYLNGSSSGADLSPVGVLKELVAQLDREQDKTQDLLSSLSFALRSFTNLNQFLELIPLMASRVTQADGGALILVRPNGQMRLERFYCSNEQYSHTMRQVLERAIQQSPAQSGSAASASTAGAGAVATPLTPPFAGPTGGYPTRYSTANPTATGQATIGNLSPAVAPAEGSLAVLDDRILHLLGVSDIQVFGVAILSKNKEQGRLYIFSYDPSYTLTETRQKLVRLVADQTAVAIENDALTIELRQKERLDRELEIGAEIQRQLLPRHCPQVMGVDLAARCLTANRVGGDYYDFIPIRHGQSAPQSVTRSRGGNPSDCWGIAVGDVMGKGVPAGLIMTMLRGMLRAEVLNGHSPARILQHLNHIMYTDLENSNRFVTLFYSEYDPHTRLLSYSNAAHNPPLLWQRSTGSVHRLDAMGMLIGLDVDSQYEDAKVQLHPGDVVIYYTDGFTDAPGAGGDRYDEDQLIRALRYACEHHADPWEILDFLFDAIQRFMGSDRANEDDMTLVVLKVAES
ncbi:MAG: PP2C family protein-serine/threonine phosphatase [Prochlorothrix sp.]|nr:PP2C family protein-serine/threonine phosphatase [Prochlorothrix sp.]